MRKTIAEDLEDNCKRETLVLLLRTRFKKLPPEIEAKILATRDTQQLNDWIVAFAEAKKLADIDFHLAE